MNIVHSGRLCRYPPRERLSAQQVLEDTYFINEPLPATDEDIAAFVSESIACADARSGRRQRLQQLVENGTSGC